VNHQPDDRLDAYLWDPTATPDPSVVAIERRLRPAQFDPLSHPLADDPAHVDRSFVRRRTLRSRWLPVAAAASLLIIAGIGFSAWRWTWPEGRAWAVRTPAGSQDTLRVGTTLETDAADRAFVSVARIGTMQVGGNTTLRLRSTASNRHRLVMQEGTVRVRVWAPPFSVSFRTPAGEVSDLGCEFELTVDGQSSRVQVTSGWVQLENLLGETLVPAGAASVMTTATRPAVPVFVDAPPGFLEAVRAHEQSPSDPEPLDRIIDLARPRDAYTLLQLIQRRSPAARQLSERAAQLFAPPAGVDPARVAAGDVRGLDRWITALPLPSPKGTWLWNWRDALPWFSRESR
jgi:ferric-dicitrate binding protein FerR (iron transport regulator)